MKTSAPRRGYGALEAEDYPEELPRCSFVALIAFFNNKSRFKCTFSTIRVVRCVPVYIAVRVKYNIFTPYSSQDATPPGNFPSLYDFSFGEKRRSSRCREVFENPSA